MQGQRQPDVIHTLVTARNLLRSLARYYRLLSHDAEAVDAVLVDINAIVFSRRDPAQTELPLGTLPEGARARTDDPDTSHEAAESITPEKLRKSQLRVLTALSHFGERGAYDEQVFDYLERLGFKATRSGTRTRRGELQRAGLVECTGRKERKQTGRRSRVHRITERGKDFLFARTIRDAARAVAAKSLRTSASGSGESC